MRFKHKKKDEIINVSNVRLVYTSDGVLHVDLDDVYPNLAKDYEPYEIGGSKDFSSVAIKKNPNDRL